MWTTTALVFYLQDCYLCFSCVPRKGISLSLIILIDKITVRLQCLTHRTYPRNGSYNEEVVWCTVTIFQSLALWWSPLLGHCHIIRNIAMAWRSMGWGNNQSLFIFRSSEKINISIFDRSPVQITSSSLPIPYLTTSHASRSLSNLPVIKGSAL